MPEPWEEGRWIREEAVGLAQRSKYGKRSGSTVIPSFSNEAQALINDKSVEIFRSTAICRESSLQSAIVGEPKGTTTPTLA